MSDIVERLRAIPVWMAGAMTPGWQEHGTSAYEAADLIESLRAENARLTEERDALALAVVAAIECGMVPKSSAREGGAVKHTRAAQVADMLRDALAKAKGGPDAR